MKPKIAIIVGHDEKKQGAYSEYLKKSEYEFNSEFANNIFSQLTHYGLEVNIFKRNKGLKDAYDRAKILGSNIFIELHFNSFSDESANGAEVLINGDNKDEQGFAQAIIDNWCEDTLIKDRGVKKVSKGKRGYRNLTQVENDISIIFEPFFGSNKDDCDKITRLNEVERLGYHFKWALIEALSGTGFSIE